MKEHWSDFEKYVFEKLELMGKSIESVDKRLLVIETRAAIIASAIALVITVGSRFI
jgi:hypothetical protein